MVASVSGWVVVDSYRVPDGRVRVVLQGPRGLRRTFTLEPWGATPTAIQSLCAAMATWDGRHT